MNQKELKELIEFLIEKDISEFELERGDVKVRIRRGTAAVASASAADARFFTVQAAPPSAPELGASPAAASPPAGPSVPVVAPPAPEEGLHIVRSPIVGTFYESPSPGSPPFVKPGDMVQMVWTCILCVSGSYGQLLDYIIFAVLVFYILTIFGLFVLRRTHPNAERPYRAIGYPVLPAIYIVMALFIDVVLLRYKPQYTWPGLIIVLLGIPVYFLWSRRLRTLSS